MQLNMYKQERHGSRFPLIRRSAGNQRVTTGMRHVCKWMEKESVMIGDHGIESQSQSSGRREQVALTHSLSHSLSHPGDGGRESCEKEIASLSRKEGNSSQTMIKSQHLNQND